MVVNKEHLCVFQTTRQFAKAKDSPTKSGSNGKKGGSQKPSQKEEEGPYYEDTEGPDHKQFDAFLNAAAEAQKYECIE